MKIDPYYQRQKCRPMILVSGNIRFMGVSGLGLGIVLVVGLGLVELLQSIVRENV